MPEHLRTVRIRLFAVVAMIFIFVSSGAFGIEDMVPCRRAQVSRS